MPLRSDSSDSDDRAGDWHRLAADEALQRLGADPARGLSQEEASARLAQHGPNAVSARGGPPAWRRFLQQLNQPLVYILIAGTIITAFFREWVDCGVIAAVVVVNAVVGFIQESKAGKAIESLGRMIVTEASVKRGGKRRRIPSRDLVPGDLVLMQAGDLVPADLRLIRTKGLQIDEAPLTGESLPVDKHAEPLPADTLLGDRKNLAFAGTLVTHGRGEGVVFDTGDRTETGRIARLISESVEIDTPLTRKIAAFSRLLLWAILGVAALAFALGMWRGEEAVEMFKVAVAIAVGAIPEGLPAAVTVVLAIGVSRMAKRRAVIRKLPAVETLGSTTVICSDKTGTLTENQMTVQRVHAGGRHYEVTGNGYGSEGDLLLDGEPVAPDRHPALIECLLAGALCNDSRVVVKDGRPAVDGDPTEGAMLVAAAKAGLSPAEAHRRAPRLDMIPFESENMFRATLHGTEEGRTIYKVGAVERLLERCDDALGPDGESLPLDLGAVRETVESMAGEGLRVLAFARRRADDVDGDLGHRHVAGGFTFLGLQGMIDPPREEAVAAVAECRRAGIEVKMITGDHAATARAIGQQLGLAQEVRAVTGAEIERMDDATLQRVVLETEIFARASPEHKLRLVKALQAGGEVVAMTGDGVNDAPALKRADIGVAMGNKGTESAKEAAEMVLADDNFASVVAAVEEGRTVYDNLKKAIAYILPTNIGQAGIVFFAVLFGLTMPITPAQILWVNMITAVTLALALAFEKAEPDIMQRRPRDPREPLLTRFLLWRIVFVGLLLVAGGMGLFLWELEQGASLAAARTAAVNAVLAGEVFYLFNMRSLTGPVLNRAGLLGNRYVLWAIGLLLACQIPFTYLPVMQALFGTEGLAPDAWLRILGFGVAVLLLVEAEKAVVRARGAA